MKAVDKGYVKQLRRRRLKAKRNAGVKGEEVDALQRSGSATDLSITVDPPSPSPSATSPRSPSLPSHCFMIPPLPPWLPMPTISTLSFWQQQVIPRWDVMQSHPLTLRQWSKEGIPAPCRCEVWARKLPLEHDRRGEALFRQYWRGERVEVEEEKGEGGGDDGVTTPRKRRADSVVPSPRRSGSTVSSPSSAGSTPSSPSSPSTPLPDTVHAFSLPAVALTAAETSIATTLDDTALTQSRRASIHNDLIRMFDADHLEDLDALDVVRGAAGLPPIFSTLHSLLATFAFYQPETSYVQGMSYMVLLLLLYLPPVDAFTCLCSLLTHDWYDAYTHMNVTAMQSRCAIFTQCLTHIRPRLASHLSSLPPDTYFIEWMLTFYIPLLSFAFTSALLDLYLLKGEEVIYRTGLALLLLGESTLLTLSAMEASHWLRGGLKDDGVDEEQLWRIMLALDLPPPARAFFASKEKTKRG